MVAYDTVAAIACVCAHVCYSMIETLPLSLSLSWNKHLSDIQYFTWWFVVEWDKSRITMIYAISAETRKLAATDIGIATATTTATAAVAVAICAIIDSTSVRRCRQCLAITDIAFTWFSIIVDRSATKAIFNANANFIVVHPTAENILIYILFRIFSPSLCPHKISYNSFCSRKRAHTHIIRSRRKTFCSQQCFSVWAATLTLDNICLAKVKRAMNIDQKSKRRWNIHIHKI